MRKLLVILFLVILFTHSYADEKKKHVPWYLSSPGNYNYSAYPPSLFDPNYLDKHNRWREYFNSFVYGPRAIVVPRPPSFSEGFLSGFSKAFSKSMDYYYRAREQERYTKAMLKLLESLDSKDYYPKSRQRYDYQPTKYFVPDREPPAVWLEKQKKKEEDDLTKFMRSQGAMYPWEYKAKKLNEYLKSLGLSLVPTNVEVHQVYDGDWIIYWDGKKWARKKKR